jgi:hypothetical protein
MPRPLQVTFDCRDPGRLAGFYARALGYELEGPPEGYGSWEELLQKTGAPREEWSSASAIVDPRGRGPRIYFQRMDTPKAGKNRVHIDINASGGREVPLLDRRTQVDAEVERLIEEGASMQRAWEEGGEYWVVMEDPEGNEFCVQ